MTKKKAKKDHNDQSAAAAAAASSSSSSKQPSTTAAAAAAAATADMIPTDRLVMPSSKALPALLLAARTNNDNHNNNNKQRLLFSMDEILPGFVWVVYSFFTQQECQAWIDFVDGGKSNGGKNSYYDKSKLGYVHHPATKYVAHRECFRWQRHDTQIANRIFERMQQCGILKELEEKVDYFKKSKKKKNSSSSSSSSNDYAASACNPNIRLYKYEKGMSFGKHVDGSDVVDGIGRTEVTVLVYLSDCQGGATRFYYPSSCSSSSGKKKAPKSIAFSPQQGAMLVHIHGDRCLEHEADPVIQGTKYILRTDIVYSAD